jgi:hypothetical protein
MSRQASNVLPISKVSMLPVINLHATDFNALYSLLTFIVRQSEKLQLGMPCVTFDQQLYVKAYEIAVSKKMNVFIRIGGFHQLMSFLGAIGTLMEGSGLRAALETVYAPVTVNHMFSGKAIARSLRGHMFAATSVLSILLEDVWIELRDEEKDQIKEMYNSDLHTENSHSELEKKLMTLFEGKRQEYMAKSRTANLWLNYVHYILIVQEFIRAERTSNWELHIAATKCMLNLLASTGHNNYTKSLRLYLQSVVELARTHPEVYRQFLDGEHTVRRTSKSWSGIWTDLSIEQILMKSLKGKGGVVGKGITENVLRVWTSTMHRYFIFISHLMQRCMIFGHTRAISSNNPLSIISSNFLP